ALLATLASWTLCFAIAGGLSIFGDQPWRDALITACTVVGGILCFAIFVAVGTETSTSHSPHGTWLYAATRWRPERRTVPLEKVALLLIAALLVAQHFGVGIWLALSKT
ncbi:MAG: hypothetical protein M3161_00655, partial [Actinomycetota bacterium]|nr:hypothetical protein [Actinomycetota bacterium]